MYFSPQRKLNSFALKEGIKKKKILRLILESALTRSSGDQFCIDRLYILFQVPNMEGCCIKILIYFA